MRSFTDTFIRHPVLAVVVNLVIVLVGWRAITTLPVQQYPNIQSSSVLITTVYYGASAETVRGFLTTPIERVVSAISGVDYVESTSRAGVSSITVHLKLHHNSTAALAEVTARLQQVRSELPALGARDSGSHRLADPQHAAPALDARGGAARGRVRRPAYRHANLDRPRPPGRAQPRARRCARGTAAQQLPRGGGADQGRPGAGQPAGQHRPPYHGRVQEPRRGPAQRGDRAAVRRGPRRAGGGGSRLHHQVQRQRSRVHGRLAAAREQRDRSGQAAAS